MAIKRAPCARSGSPLTRQGGDAHNGDPEEGRSQGPEVDSQEPLVTGTDDFDGKRFHPAEGRGRAESERERDRPSLVVYSSDQPPAVIQARRVSKNITIPVTPKTSA